MLHAVSGSPEESYSLYINVLMAATTSTLHGTASLSSTFSLDDAGNPEVSLQT